MFRGGCEVIELLVVDVKGDVAETKWVIPVAVLSLAILAISHEKKNAAIIRSAVAHSVVLELASPYTIIAAW